MKNSWISSQPREGSGYSLAWNRLTRRNLKDVNKGFNKPGEYAQVLERLAKRNVYAITSFIFGMDNDTTGVAERTLAGFAARRDFLFLGLLTPLPALLE